MKTTWMGYSDKWIGNVHYVVFKFPGGVYQVVNYSRDSADQITDEHYNFPDK